MSRAKLSNLMVLLACGLGLASCGSNPSTKYEGMAADALHAHAKRLPLEERYAMYLDVYDDQTPRNPILARDVAELGDPVRALAGSRAEKADFEEFGAILSLFSAFGRSCSVNEKSTLLRAAQRLDTSEEQLSAHRGWIETACSG